MRLRVRQRDIEADSILSQRDPVLAPVSAVRMIRGVASDEAGIKTIRH